ncbi:DUF721 domain-containing protein [Vibrio ostreae]|uniref:DUF721 domain-containing protein n=1 Tax=Vibrio ostreae TaxID=2841925 RepID=A0A975U986_9VIBR|nr:DciA family protein [Vibrio ostreae]QXO16911.1 DUF721 domain-containing protein [Vibrio ostreae]
MRDHRPTNTEELLEASRLKQVQEHAKEILQLNQILTTLLPRGTEKHVRAANIRGGHLILEAASAAIKMKIDYDRLSLLNQLRAQGFGRLISIEIRINPALYRGNSAAAAKKDEAKARPPLTDHAAHVLMTIAENASPKVRKRLESLAKLAKK